MDQNEKSKQLLEEYNDIMIAHSAKLLALEQEEEIEELFDKLAELPEPEYSDEFKQDMRRLFDAAENSECTTKNKKVLPLRKKILSVAACVMGVFVIGGSVLTMSSDAFIEHLKYMVGKNFSTHTTFVIENNIPDRFKESMIENGWTEILYPSYLPSGYKLEDVICTKLRCRFEFSNGDKKLTLSIKRLVEASKHMIDTENAIVNYKYINGNKVKTTYIEKDSMKNLFFVIGDRIVHVSSESVGKMKIIDVSESLMAIYSEN